MAETLANLRQAVNRNADCGKRNGVDLVEAQGFLLQTLESAIRPTDFVGRWLEHEFLLILTECGETDLLKVGEHLRKMVNHSQVSWLGDKYIKDKGGEAPVAS